MKKIFTIPADPFKQDINVVIGGGYKEYAAWMKKKGYEEDELLESVFADKIESKSHGFTAFRPGQPIILWLEDYKNDWFFTDTLLHELHHVVFKLSEHFGTETEMECQAHLFISLLQKIRKEVNKPKKKPKKKK